jgi:hypothetical protein
MDAEYQRLEAEASEVQWKIDELVQSSSQIVAVDFQKVKPKIAQLHRRLAGTRLGMGLLKVVGSAKMRADVKKLIKSQPKAFHSQGTRSRKVQLIGGTSVTLNVTYYHRAVCGRSKEQKSDSWHVSCVNSAVGLLMASLSEFSDQH